MFSQGKLGSLVDIISQAMQDGDILSIEFHKVFQDVEKYRKFKADVRNQAKTKISRPFHASFTSLKIFIS